MDEICEFRCSCEGSNILYSCPQVSKRDRFAPAAEWFRRVNTERFVLEDRVRTDQMKDQAPFGVIALLEPFRGSIADRKEHLGGFEPTAGALSFGEILSDPELFALEPLALFDEFLVREQVAETELGEVLALALYAELALFQRTSAGSVILGSDRAQVMKAGQCPAVEVIRD